jgi:transcriptional regulator with GAF, ATPase, and Fis domain
MAHPNAGLFPASRHKILDNGTVLPRLAVIEGPLKGSIFEIAAETFSIGRKPDCTLCPADLSISRQHCSIEMAGEHFRLIDHESQNGTFVNGTPVRERVLAHGDQIAAGASLFVFLLDDADPLPAASTPDAAPPPLRHRIVGESPAIRNVLEFIAKVAPLDSTVLISGESGTGKHQVARALHENSPRAGKPFVVLNCAAWRGTCLESQLLGHERGAFPGAVDRKKGKLELAEGGTLFVDAIADLAPPLQSKLLRVLREKQFERLGGARALDADVRVIAATGRNLAFAAQEGVFRADLFFRLSVLSVEIPPLRRRREDIPLLANYFRVEQAARQKRHVMGISSAARECLMRYDWPGNVRELEGAIASAVALGSTEGILPEDLPESVLPTGDTPDDVVPRFHRALVEARREMILKAYREACGDPALAAAVLGLHPNSLLGLVRRLDLQPAIDLLSGEE